MYRLSCSLWHLLIFQRPGDPIPRCSTFRSTTTRGRLKLLRRFLPLGEYIGQTMDEMLSWPLQPHLKKTSKNVCCELVRTWFADFNMMDCCQIQRINECFSHVPKKLRDTIRVSLKIGSPKSTG